MPPPAAFGFRPVRRNTPESGAAPYCLLFKFRESTDDSLSLLIVHCFTAFHLSRSSAQLPLRLAEVRVLLPSFLPLQPAEMTLIYFNAELLRDGEQNARIRIIIHMRGHAIIIAKAMFINKPSELLVRFTSRAFLLLVSRTPLDRPMAISSSREARLYSATIRISS
jgi:hypothetical protein